MYKEEETTNVSFEYSHQLVFIDIIFLYKWKDNSMKVTIFV